MTNLSTEQGEESVARSEEQAAKIQRQEKVKKASPVVIIILFIAVAFLVYAYFNKLGNPTQWLIMSGVILAIFFFLFQQKNKVIGILSPRQCQELASKELLRWKKEPLPNGVLVIPPNATIDFEPVIRLIKNDYGSGREPEFYAFGLTVSIPGSLGPEHYRLDVDCFTGMITDKIPLGAPYSGDTDDKREITMPSRDVQDRIFTNLLTKRPR